MKCFFNVLLSYLLISLILAGGCAHKNAPEQKDIEAKGGQFAAISRTKGIDVKDEPYLGAKPIALRTSDAPALLKNITLRKRGALESFAATISALLPEVSVHVGEVEVEPSAKAEGSSDPLFLPPPGVGGSASTKEVSINYEGPLRGLLEQLSVKSGYGWDYNAQSNSITFAKVMVRTFTLLGAPGKVTYDNQITNKSKENATSGSIGGASGGVSQTAQTADTSIQTAQVNKTELKFDIWADTEKEVKALLSKTGTVTSNQATGSLTVRDKPENIRQVASFIDEINARLSRQVALTVQVWALEISDESEAGLDLQVLFQNNDISVVAGSLAALGGLNTASATIVSGKLKNSTAILKALKKWGNATQVTSGGGLALSNQPVPILAIQRHAYLAGAASTETNYGQTTQITPGEVTSGFSMTIIPHILDKRRAILQYNINLSSLDSMEEIKASGITVQLPQTSTRAFSQRTTMQMGQTLVLAGFQHERQTVDKKAGILSLGRSAGYNKTLLVITIELENAGIGVGA